MFSWGWETSTSKTYAILKNSLYHRNKTTSPLYWDATTFITFVKGPDYQQEQHFHAYLNNPQFQLNYFIKMLQCCNSQPEMMATHMKYWHSDYVHLFLLSVEGLLPKALYTLKYSWANVGGFPRLSLSHTLKE